MLKDIEERLNRKEKLKGNSRATDAALLKSITKSMSGVVSIHVSIRSISNYLISNKEKVSSNIASDYVSSLCDAYLYDPADAMDIYWKRIAQIKNIILQF